MKCPWAFESIRHEVIFYGLVLASSGYVFSKRACVQSDLFLAMCVRDCHLYYLYIDREGESSISLVARRLIFKVEIISLHCKVLVK